MSMTEIAQVMKEAGLMAGGSSTQGSGGGGAAADKIRVEHMLVLDVSEKWEKIIKGIALACLELGRHLVDSVRIVAVAGAVGVLLWGTSQLVASFRSPQQPRLRQDNETN
jgi:hypothetical protein